ncbi:MAG TPA: glycoside hydrolase family 3 N-terminal domain-containing protein, partial [Streptosporangiaceae bacterium]|nr:glycoside hydrolase family 3 N-terminal domain-containing protein [Streptosporangiaceae bacterium]
MSQDASLNRLADAVLVPPFPGITVPGWLLSALERGLAGVTLFGLNVADAAQVAKLTMRLRNATDEPVIAIDEEGGDVTRIAHRTGSPYPGNAALGAVDDAVLTTEIYRALGLDLAAVGINVDLAPSVDVNTAADNPVIGTRSFGADTGLVARHAAAAVTGLQSAGVAACAKHFPGHGSTSADSHHVLASVDGGLDELRRRDLPPFEAAIEAGVQAIMPGHLRVPGLTGGLPATWSAAAITGLLRGELGFSGVVISDALEMRAVSKPHGVPEAAVRALAAGADLLCLGRDQDEEMYLAVRAAVAAAITAGRLPAERAEEAGRRVAALRAWLAGARPDGAAAVPGDGNAVRARDALAGLAAARRALRVSGLSRPLADPLVVELRPLRNIAVGSVPWGLGPWLHGGVYRIDTGPDEVNRDHAIEDVLTKAAGRPLVVVVRDAHRHPAARAVTTALLSARPDTVVVEMGLPLWRPASGGYVATYGAARPN